jgi:hypothetical protein
MYQFNRFILAFTPPAPLPHSSPFTPQVTEDPHGWAYAFQAVGAPRYQQSPGVVAGVGYSLPKPMRSPFNAADNPLEDAFTLVTQRDPSVGYQTAVYEQATGRQLGVFHPWWGWRQPKQPKGFENTLPNTNLPTPLLPNVVKRLLTDIETHHIHIAQPKLHQGQFISTSRYQYPNPRQFNGYYYGQRLIDQPSVNNVPHA